MAAHEARLGEGTGEDGADERRKYGRGNMRDESGMHDVDGAARGLVVGKYWDGMVCRVRPKMVCPHGHRKYRRLGTLRLGHPSTLRRFYLRGEHCEVS